MTAGTLKERVVVTFAINTHSIRKRPAQTVLTILGLSGAVLTFLPFFDGYVPMEVFLDDMDEFLILALLFPFVALPFFVSAGYVHWVLGGKLSRWESTLGYALALIVVALLTLVIIGTWWESGFNDNGFFIFVFLAIGLGGGIWFVMQNLYHGTPSQCITLVAMQLAYLPFALGWLAALPGNQLINDFGSILDLPVGAYLAFLTVVVYTAQIALSVRGRSRAALRLLPLGLAWLPWVGVLVSVWLEG